MKISQVLRYSTFVFRDRVQKSATYCCQCQIPRSYVNRNFELHRFFSVKKTKGTAKMAESSLKQQYFDYFLVLDFEATCQENKVIYPQEIIEFPVLKINSKTLETEAIFHQYVQPRVHKELTPFCVKLTGIIQDMVDGQPHIEEVLQKLDKWMADNNLLDDNVKSVFVTCGDWDLMKMLPSQSNHFKFKTPGYLSQWLNIKKAYAEVTGTYPRGLLTMLEELNIKQEGRHHSGIDDCKNIGNILIELLKRGYVGKITGRLR